MRIHKSAINKYLLLGLMGVGLAVPPAHAQVVGGTFLPPGDINGDLQVTVADAIEVMRFTAGLRPLVNAERTAADVAPAVSPGRMWGNGTVNVEDAVRIMRRSVGLEPDPWPGGPALEPSTNGTRFTLTQAGGPYRVTVNEGVRVTGQLIDQANKPLVADLYYWNATRRLLGKVTPNAQGNFTIVAPAGLYEFSTITRVTDAASGATVQIPHPNIITIQLTAGMAPITVRRGALPTLFKVSARFSSVPANFAGVRIEFLDLDRQFEFNPPPTLARSGPPSASGVYTLFVPNGNYKTLAVLNRKNTAGTVTGTVALLPEQSVGVFQNRDVNLFLPPIGSQSGTFSDSGVTKPQGKVFAATIQPAQNGGGAEGKIVDGTYHIPLQNNVTYRTAYLPALLNPASPYVSELAYVPSDVSVSGNITKNIILPQPAPVRKTMRFWVGDEFGRPVPNARVRLVSFNLGAVSQDYEMRVDADASSQGVVSLDIPEGTYQITVGPTRTLSVAEEVDAPVE